MVMTTWSGAATAMGDPVLAERLPALWRCIEDAHYVYLEIDDSPEKLQQRKKLEGYIMEYLSLVPHECKFGLSETGKVFQRTISELPDFSAYRAGLGWAALGRYASNLLAQPWRKEYKTIRLYCGYYKHEIDGNLVGAEMLLHQMGYRAEGASRLALDGPVCPDMVAAVSRDALIAHVECQIMCQVWESAWSAGVRVSWPDVGRERARRVGDAAAAAARLALALHEPEIYSNLPATVVMETHQNNRQPELTRHPQYNQMCPPLESPIEEPIVPMVHPASYMGHPPHLLPQNLVYPVPPQHIHPEVPVTLNQCGPIPVMTPYGAMPYYYTPVQAPYMLPTPVFTEIKHAATVPINGYPHLPQYRYPAVPTAALIELDAPSVYENGGKYDRSLRDLAEKNYSRRSKGHVDSAARNSTSKSFSDVSLPSIPRSDTQPALSKAREDGMGTYESWDYVFRNLSSKEQVESRSRFSPSLDRDSRTLDRYDRDERRSRYQPTTLDLEDGLQALNLDRSYDEEVYRTAKVNENLMRIKQENEVKKARHLARKHASEEKIKKRMEPVGNPTSDGLINTKVAPDKIRLLTKKDVKDKKDVIKQQSLVNGSAKSNHVDVKKVRKSSKSSADAEKPVRLKAPLENGHSGAPHVSKSVPGSSNASHQSSNHSYDAKTHLIVSLDETDSIVRRSPPKHQTQNGDHERPTSRNSIRQNGDVNIPQTKEEVKSTKWECSTCTYINSCSVSACEICGKSRNVGPEVLPLMSGGRECPACTLVNKRDATVCDACGNDLKHCPTYI